MTDLKKKILWQCRRGLWELDQILLPFVENNFENLKKEDQLLFQKLLQYEDIELFDIFVNKVEPKENKMKDLTLLIVDKHMKNQNGFTPNYLACIDKKSQLLQFTDEFDKIEIPCFFNWDLRNSFSKKSNQYH